MYSLLTELVTQFCEALLAHQVHSDDSWDGGIRCPACKCLHGRCGDAVFALYFSYLSSGQAKYLEGARRLLAYQRRTQLPDGAWVSMETSSWKGTTVFKLLALEHAYDVLNRAGLDEEERGLLELIARAAGWVSQVFGEERIKNNVNYFVTSATALEWASRILDIPRYHQQGQRLISKYGLGSLNRDGFLVGETTPKSITAVDIGYNLDMSLGAMAEYALLSGDANIKAETVRTLHTHLNFIYPDGSIDNSFGCRSYKWTLFGSKTAHACQMALCLLCDEDPVFARAAERNARYLGGLASAGIIGYGPHYWDYFSEGCIHASANRADALSVAIAYGKQPRGTAACLPSEEIFGVRVYPSINVAHVRTETLHATLSCFATRNAPSGGTLSYLWSQQAGPLQVGCVTRYDRDDEAQNIPEPPQEYGGPITPRMEAVCAGRTLSNLHEHEAHLAVLQPSRPVRVQVQGQLKEADGGGREFGLGYRIDYTFMDRRVEKQYVFDLQVDCEQLSVCEPLVCRPGRAFSLIDGVIQMQALQVRGAGQGFMFRPPDANQRVFSVFPSLACVPLRWQLDGARAGVYQFNVTIYMAEE